MSDWESDEDLGANLANVSLTSNGTGMDSSGRGRGRGWKAGESSGPGNSHQNGFGRFDDFRSNDTSMFGAGFGGRGRGMRGKNHSNPASLKCGNCGGIGHTAQSCPSPSMNGGFEAVDHSFGNSNGRIRTCYQCGREGHISSDCPSSGGGRNQNGCFNCHRDGHIARDCPSERRMGGSDKTPTNPDFVPHDESVEALFNSRISTGINFEAHQKVDCFVSCDNPDAAKPAPIKTFAECNLRRILNENIDKSGYQKPTPVQQYSIPIMMAGHDLMSCAQTGSGKTAAFLLPILHNLLEDPAEINAGADCQTPQAVILAPTRELAKQIYDESRKFSNGSRIKNFVSYGGTSTRGEASRMTNGVNVLVGCPGRILDNVRRGRVSFQSLRFLVLDEADRMLDMGFGEDLEQIIKHSSMPPKEKRQTVMFSATFPDEIQRTARCYLSDNYFFLAVGIVGGANRDIVQTVVKVSKFEKRDKLVEILKDLKMTNPDCKVLVFAERKRDTDFLGAYLCGVDLPATTIHGDREQPQREEALRDFKSGKMTILVATRVAARGLDIPKVDHVINYDLPREFQDYVHQIGRTGRMGNTGTATSFYDPDHDANVAKDLVNTLAKAEQPVEDWLAKEANRMTSGPSLKGFNGYSSRDMRDRGGDFHEPPPIEDEERWD